MYSSRPLKHFVLKAFLTASFMDFTFLLLSDTYSFENCPRSENKYLRTLCNHSYIASLKDFFEKIIVHCLLLGIFPWYIQFILEWHGNGVITLTMHLKIFCYHLIIFHINVSRFIIWSHLAHNVLERLSNAVLDHFLFCFLQLFEFWTQIII